MFLLHFRLTHQDVQPEASEGPDKRCERGHQERPALPRWPRLGEQDGAGRSHRNAEERICTVPTGRGK